MPSFISPSELVQNLRWRYATKQFDSSRKITPEIWSALEETLVLTPSSFGLQPWKFFVVTDSATKQKLLPFSWNQPQVTDCSHHVVMAIQKNLGETQIDEFLKNTAETRGTTVQSMEGYRGMMVGNLVKGPRHSMINEWATFQVYIALGNLMTAAAMIGVDACPMEGIDADRYDEVLGLQGTEYHTVVACPLGYRASTDKYATLAKVRYPKSKIIQMI